MYPWRRILVPTDFSTASEWVFDDAIRAAGLTGAEIIILHVRMTWGSHPDELRLPADASVYEYAEQIELERLREHIRGANAAVSTRLVVKQAPDAGKEIVLTATEEDADLIVIATHARHHVAHLLIGSTTLSVLSSPTTPVLAIRYGTRKREALRRFLVPVHLQQTSNAALELAGAIAAHDGGEVHLLTVCDSSRRDEAERKIDELSARLPFPAHQTIIDGDQVPREIVRYADKHDVDAVLLNASESPGPVKIDIIRHVPVPVMIVPGAN